MKKKSKRLFLSDGYSDYVVFQILTAGQEREGNIQANHDAI